MRDARHVSGTLRDGRAGRMRFNTTRLRNGRVVWEQVAACDATRGLSRVYVGNETFAEIVRHWLPCDWRTFVVESEWGGSDDEEGGDALSTLPTPSALRAGGPAPAMAASRWA